MKSHHFLIAVIIGATAIFIYTRLTATAVSKATTYTDSNGDPIFAGPSIDPMTGSYLAPGAKPGTVGFSAQPIGQ